MDSLTHRSTSLDKASCSARSLCMFRWISTAMPSVVELFSSSSSRPRIAPICLAYLSMMLSGTCCTLSSRSCRSLEEAYPLSLKGTRKGIGKESNLTVWRDCRGRFFSLYVLECTCWSMNSVKESLLVSEPDLSDLLNCSNNFTFSATSLPDFCLRYRNFSL